MANLPLILISTLITLLISTEFQLLVQGLALPVTKDPSTLQYITRFRFHHQGTTTNLVLDLGGPFLWASGTHCSSSSSSSGSNPLIPGSSLQCARAKAHQYDHPSKTRSTPTCHLPTLNTVTGDETGSGQLVEVNGFLFSCAPEFLLAGLASGSSGMLGLGRGSGIGPLSQQVIISGSARRKFFTCLSPSNGVVLLGGDEQVNVDALSKSLLYTPLVVPAGPSSPSSSSSPVHDYFININSIRVNGGRVPVEGNIGIAKISSVVPYTTLSSSVYGPFVRAYELAAASMNMTRVEPVSPFGLCFSSGGGEEGVVVGGPPVVPVVDFVLQSEMVRWRVNGRNSVVVVEAGGGGAVVCLGLLDGGPAMGPEEVVIGGLQLEDNLLEFDLGTNMLGFSCTNLLSATRQFSCSDFLSRFDRPSDVSPL